MNPDTNNEVASTTKTMTTQEINKRIAIACGWLDIKEQDDDCGTTGLWGVPARHAKAVGLGSAFEYPIPNYHGDLNAMHGAEKWVENQQWWKFVDHLIDICGGGTALGISATAAQRAEAFLRTIGQWEDEK